MTGDFRAALEIHQAQSFAQFDVIQRLEAECWRFVTAVPYLEIRLVVATDWRVGVRQVGNRATGNRPRR